MAIQGHMRPQYPLSVSSGHITPTAGVLFGTTILAMFYEAWRDEGYASLIFIVAIMAIGGLYGFARAMIAAIIGAAVYQFFAADPVWHLNSQSWSDVSPPLVFLLCAAISGLVSGRLRDQPHQADERMQPKFEGRTELS